MTSLHRGAVDRLYARANAGRWALSTKDLAAALERSIAARFHDAGNPSSADVDAYLDSLRIEDLALAAACECGSAPAWDHFIREHRPHLYAAARALLRDEGRAREIADSLWAELYGLEERAGKRRSLLAYFHGRSALATWLRTLVAQRHADLRRAERKMDPLDPVESGAVPQGRSPSLDAGDPDRRRYLELVRHALAAALGAIASVERLRLSLYYLEDLTLAEVGRALGEHESTVSRQLDRSRRKLRRDTERWLRREGGLGAEQIRLALDYATEEWPYDLGMGPTNEARNRRSGVLES